MDVSRILVFLTFLVTSTFLLVECDINIKPLQFEANFETSPYREFFNIAPYAGYLFRRNDPQPGQGNASTQVGFSEETAHSGREYIAMPQCQIALMEPGEALINKVCSRIVRENNWEDDIVVAYRCFTRSIDDRPHDYRLQVRPVTSIRYEVNGSAAFVYFRAPQPKGECTVVLSKDHPLGKKVHDVYSIAREFTSTQYCAKCRPDLKLQPKDIEFSEVTYTEPIEKLKDDVPRAEYEKLFNGIIDPYLRMSSFAAVYYRGNFGQLSPHCTAFLLNRGIAFINVFECKLSDRPQAYVIVYRCFHGEGEEYYLKRGQVNSVSLRDDGTEIYFTQHWDATCRPKAGPALSAVSQIRPKGEL